MSSDYTFNCNRSFSWRSFQSGEYAPQTRQIDQPIRAAAGYSTNASNWRYSMQTTKTPQIQIAKRRNLYKLNQRVAHLAIIWLVMAVNICADYKCVVHHWFMPLRY
jgi:hypothetical protein